MDPSSTPRQRKRVALLIDTATTWGAGLIEGIADFAHAHADWQFYVGPRGKYEKMLLPDHWVGDGVIARITHLPMVEQLLERGIPAIDVSWYRLGGSRIAHCTCDEKSVAELAVKYFLDRGFRQFAYCGSGLRPGFADRLGEAFKSALGRRNFGCKHHIPRSEEFSLIPGPQECHELQTWLHELPKPCALLAFDSVQARQITDVCHMAEIQVPHEVAVMGGEHDLLSCTISKPQLSSIDHSPYRVGQEAAAMLARLMEGEQLPSMQVALPAARVISRQSTETVAIADDLLAASVEFIKKHSHEKINVSDILRAVPISRRALEKGFRKYLSRSPSEEIRHTRVEQAIRLLCDTAWPMPQVAVACGFECPELLTRAFRRELDTTPSAFRKQYLRDRHVPSAGAKVHGEEPFTSLSNVATPTPRLPAQKI